MNYGWIILLTIGLLGCKHDYSPLHGEWRVDSPFYKAKYHIGLYDDAQKCAVVSYDDGTSRYYNSAGNPYFLYDNIKHHDGHYIVVDGMSGATVIAGQTTLNLKNNDTLQVTTYIHHKPLVEQWIRLK